MARGFLAADHDCVGRDRIDLPEVKKGLRPGIAVAIGNDDSGIAGGSSGLYGGGLEASADGVGPGKIDYPAGTIHCVVDRRSADGQATNGGAEAVEGGQIERSLAAANVGAAVPNLQ